MITDSDLVYTELRRPSWLVSLTLALAGTVRFRFLSLFPRCVSVLSVLLPSFYSTLSSNHDLDLDAIIRPLIDALVHLYLMVLISSHLISALFCSLQLALEASRRYTRSSTALDQEISILIFGLYKSLIMSKRVKSEKAFR